MVIDVLAVLSLPGDDNGRVSGLQRGHDGSDASVTDDAVDLRHGINYIIIGHELNPDGIRHLWHRGGAPVLDDEIFAAAGQRLDQVERSWERLLVGTEAKKDQRRFRTSGHA